MFDDQTLNDQPSMESLQQAARYVLENPWWEPTLKVMTRYSRLHDDCMGEPQGNIIVTMGPDADAWVTIDTRETLRFRTPAGGGKSFRTRNALMILALAMKLDEEQPLD